MRVRRLLLTCNLVCDFYRSGGDRGATVETLRGQHGADFEGYALVHRGETGGCGCFGGKNLEKLILIKGPFCFVFEHEKDLAPKYAISLAHLKAKKQEQSHSLGPGLTTLETSLGDVEYEINFQGEEEAKTFVTTANKQAAKGESQEVRKVCLVMVGDYILTIQQPSFLINFFLLQRLGHEHLLNKRSSIRFAEQVALKKVQDQPEKAENITGEDLVQINMAAGF